MTGTLGTLLAAAAFFVASHLVLSSPALRAPLVARLGERAFLGLYSVVALAALAWLVLAYNAAPYVELWPLSAWAPYVPLAVMPFAAILLVCGLTTKSPTAIGGGAPPADDPAPGILKVTRHPVLWAIVLWALAHVPPNGDAASLILFGALAGLSAAGMPSIDRRRRATLGDAWKRLAETTSVWPFAALVSGRARLGFGEIGVWRILGVVALYLALLLLHAPVIGPSALPG